MRARLALALVGSTAMIAVLAFGVFPTRLWLTQRRDMAETSHRVEVLEDTNAALERRVKELDSDAAIERIAREQHNLVKPGEEAYAILPPPVPTPGIDALAEFLRGLRLWP